MDMLEWEYSSEMFTVIFKALSSKERGKFHDHLKIPENTMELRDI